MEEDKRLDEYYKSKGMDIDVAKELVSNLMKVPVESILNIEVLKKGFTNTSFVFEYNKSKYIMRVPGNGTEKIINRQEEANVYKELSGKNICEDIVYIDGKSGYKIAKFYEDSKSADSFNNNDVKACMKRLKEFHEMKLKVEHEFNLFEKINFYEKMWNNNPPRRENYYQIKENIFELKEFIDKQEINKSLCHIDSLADNFLILNNGDVRLIDWEYAGMQDPHLDIAMFAIYAMYDRKQFDNLIDIYFEGKCENNIRLKIYAYIAICGLLWNNWAEYKINLGEELEEYAISQYKYAIEYYEIVKNELKRMEN